MTAPPRIEMPRSPDHDRGRACAADRGCATPTALAWRALPRRLPGRQADPAALPPPAGRSGRLLRRQADPAPPPPQAGRSRGASSASRTIRAVPPPAGRSRAASSAGRPTPRRPLRRQA